MALWTWKISQQTSVRETMFQDTCAWREKLKNIFAYIHYPVIESGAKTITRQSCTELCLCPTFLLTTLGWEYSNSSERVFIPLHLHTRSSPMLPRLWCESINQRLDLYSSHVRIISVLQYFILAFAHFSWHMRYHCLPLWSLSRCFNFWNLNKKIISQYISWIFQLFTELKL